MTVFQKKYCLVLFGVNFSKIRENHCTILFYFEKKSDDLYKLKRYEEAIQSYDKFMINHMN
jgi:hypothetical protein